MATMDNLQEAFAGESQANRKYLAFAKKAERDGYPQVAKLFRAAAEAETVHAHAHLRAMGEVKTTAENLKAAIEGEGFEFQNMYPKFVAEAEKEENSAALMSFQNALAVEEVHLPRDAEWTWRHELKLLDGVTVLETEAVTVPGADPAGPLYQELPTGKPRRVPIRLIPYYAWNNRGEPKMTVWMPLY